MGLVEHLKSPQLTDEAGRPTVSRPGVNLIPTIAPGAPRWQGYLTYLLTTVVGAVLWRLGMDLGIIFLFVCALFFFEVWWGKAIFPWWRPDPDE